RIPRPQEPVLEALVNLKDEPSGGIMAGYGWIFPLGDGVVNVGAGLLNTFKRFKEMSARKLMDYFIADLPPEWGITEENAISPIISGHMPTRMNRDDMVVPRMLLVAGAGSRNNPFDRRWMPYAIEARVLAAVMVR